MSPLQPFRDLIDFNDKYLFNAAAKSLGLPVPNDLAVLDPEFGRTFDGRPLRNADHVRAFLSGPAPDGLVFKPVNGIEGRRVLVFGGCQPSRHETLVSLDGRVFSPDDLIKYMTDQVALRREFPKMKVRSFLIEERINGR